MFCIKTGSNEFGQTLLKSGDELRMRKEKGGRVSATFHSANGSKFDKLHFCGMDGELKKTLLFDNTEAAESFLVLLDATLSSVGKSITIKSAKKNRSTFQIC